MAEQVRFGFVISLAVQQPGRAAGPLRPPVRAELYRISGEAIHRAGIAEPQVHREDREDGILFVVAPGVPPQLLLGAWLQHLHQTLRQGNRNAREVLRLRVGLHAGPVTADPRGRSGPAVELARRLSGSAEAARLMRAAPAAVLLVVVSDELHRDRLHGDGEGSGADRYRPLTVRLPEGDRQAWYRLPGVPVPARPAAPTGVEPPGTPVGGRPGPTWPDQR
ncbi:hypothetical protein ACFW1A_31605 [Kitasatospora sp. NPDC058965]|uniref:hypothetical protein n=1 Tax=Kitasatospora sp. NPDC058965 TaxID=3346682 RepID=UPI0036D00E71